MRPEEVYQQNGRTFISCISRLFLSKQNICLARTHPDVNFDLGLFSYKHTYDHSTSTLVYISVRPPWNPVVS